MCFSACRVQVPVCVKVSVPSNDKSTFADTGAFFAEYPADTVTTFDFVSEAPDYYDHYVTASSQSFHNQSGSPSRGRSPTAGARETRHKRRTKRTCL